MKIVMFLVGLLVVFVLGFLISSDRKKIKYKPIALMLVIQLVLAYFLLNTKVGFVLVKGIADGFGAILKFAEAGVNFVFGGLANDGQAPFFLTVLLPIIFLAVLIGILQHIKILPIIIRAVGFLLSKVNGLGKLESYNAVAAAIVGQRGSIHYSKRSIKQITEKSFIHTLCIFHVYSIDVNCRFLYEND